MRRRRGRAGVGVVLLAAVVVQGCAALRGPRRAGPGWEQRGRASWYGPGFHGQATASGERYDMKELTAAHRDLPFGALVEVRNLDNGLTVRVRINDRGPFVGGRIIDLSWAAARAIDMIGPGTARVELRLLGAAPVPAAAVYLVQVGAFQEADRARALERELRRDYPQVETRSEDGWHRVVIGPFSQRRRAEATARRLAADGHPALVRSTA